MSDRLRIACVQMCAGPVKADNLATAERLVGEAASAGARLVVLPETWNAWGSADVLRANAEPLEDGATVAALAGWARRHGVAIVGG